MPRVYTQGIKIAHNQSSSIQTLLSVLEFHQFNAEALADYTAGREFHPALKMYSIDLSIALPMRLVKMGFLWYDYSVTAVAPVRSVTGVVGVVGKTA